MKNKLYLGLAILLVILAFILLARGCGITMPKFEDVAATLSTEKGIEVSKQNQDYRPIIDLFVAPKPAVVPRPVTGIVQPTPAPTPMPTAPLPVLRYIGSIINDAGVKLYLFRDAGNGRLVRVGKGVPYEEIEFVEEKNDSILLKINGREVSIKK